MKEYNNWKDKTVCFLGDSITDGIGVHPGERYFDILEKELGFHAHGYGVNGATFFNLYAQTQKMNLELGKNIDAICLLAGTNDFFKNIPVGEWYTYSEAEVVIQKSENNENNRFEKRKVRQFNFDTNTFKGSINYVLSYLKHTYPDKRIILFTPIHRAYAEFGPQNIAYSEAYSNSIGIFFNEYLEAVREASQIWSTELIDLNCISGLFPLYDESAELYFTNFYTDRLHPNQAGHKRMAEAILNSGF